MFEYPSTRLKDGNGSYGRKNAPTLARRTGRFLSGREVADRRRSIQPAGRSTHSASPDAELKRISPAWQRQPARRLRRRSRRHAFQCLHPRRRGASLLFNYFIPKGFSEQLFLKPKGSYKKDEMLFPVSYCSHLYKPIPFLLCTSSSFPLARNGLFPAAAPYWTATPCAQGNVAGCRP